MWHLKTKLGTFWIVDDTKEAEKFYLGCNDQNIGEYDSLDTLLEDLCKQETGYLKWDEQLRVKAPKEIEAWVEGAPENW